MEFGVQNVTAGAPEALLAAPEIVVEKAPVREPRTASLSQWALSFQP